MALIQKFLLCLCIVYLASNVVAGHKILIIVHFPMKSHAILGKGFVEALVEANHSFHKHYPLLLACELFTPGINLQILKVTFVCPFPTGLKHPNLREIDITSLQDALPAGEVTIDKIVDNVKPPEFVLNHVLYKISTSTLKHPNFDKILRDPQEKFDLVIAEWMISELNSGLSAVFNCPLIWLSTMEPNWMVLRLVDETPNPAYTIDFRQTRVHPMNFQERVTELFGQAYSSAIYWLQRQILDEPTYKDIFAPLVEKRGRSLPPYDEMRYSASMLLSNGYVSLSEPIKLAASVKMIGGYHIDTQALQTVEQDLQRIMDDSKDGFIYFSMGSHLQSSAFPDSIKKGLLEMFGTLNQTVLWKYEIDDIRNLPKNVHIRKWIPQLSVLGHPNCRLFISHGGLLSLMEANSQGVPVLGVPAFGDQHVNIFKAVRKGYARKVILNYDLHKQMGREVNEMMNNSRYAETAKHLSLIYHHRMMPPRAELIHWVEEVLITGGARHLRSPALDITWYQKLFLDLLVLVLGVLYSLRLVYKRLISKSVKKSDVRKKVN